MRYLFAPSPAQQHLHCVPAGRNPLAVFSGLRPSRLIKLVQSQGQRVQHLIWSLEDASVITGKFAVKFAVKAIRPVLMCEWPVLQTRMLMRCAWTGVHILHVEVSWHALPQLHVGDVLSPQLAFCNSCASMLVMSVCAGYIVSRATQTVGRGRDLAIRTARQPPEQQADYYYRNLLGPDWEQQLQQASMGQTEAVAAAAAVCSAKAEGSLQALQSFILLWLCISSSSVSFLVAEWRPATSNINTYSIARVTSVWSLACPAPLTCTACM